tara:strand:+ start:31 stop:231 length:201 start_codon:yes stop_codon:yes gene_type:complete
MLGFCAVEVLGVPPVNVHSHDVITGPPTGTVDVSVNCIEAPSLTIVESLVKSATGNIPGGPASHPT